MALPSSGAISISNCSVELGWAANANNHLNHATMRALANVPSGTIRLSNFYGKSWNMRWSGSTVANTYFGIEGSGNYFRVPGGNWLFTYHDTFQSGDSYYATQAVRVTASGNALRASRSTYYSSTWVYWAVASGFTGVSETPEWGIVPKQSWRLETAGGQVRAVFLQNATPYYYGAYVYLY